MRSVALVHDWLEAPGGGEAVLTELAALYPHAEIFTLVDFLTPAERAKLRIGATTTSSLQHLPGARHWFRYAAVLYPQVVERLDVSRHDLVISNTHAVAKGVRTRPGQLHVCYCFTPPRFAWTMASTYHDRAAGDNRWRGALAHRLLSRFRAWDRAASGRVDHFIALSQHIARAINDCYGRQADVVYPPVDVARFRAGLRLPHDGPYVTVSRLVPYKRIDLIIEAFRRMPSRRLVVVGDGPERERLSSDLPSNVTLTGKLDDDATVAIVGGARAFMFAALEDFGIAPLEAQAAGTPVIAYDAGAIRETIVGLDHPRPTGVLYPRQDTDSIVEAVERFERESSRIDAADCVANASRFTAVRFRDEFSTRVDALWAAHRSAHHPSHL